MLNSHESITLFELINRVVAPSKDFAELSGAVFGVLIHFDLLAA
jgi:hypothetical protein